MRPAVLVLLVLTACGLADAPSKRAAPNEPAAPNDRAVPDRQSLQLRELQKVAGFGGVRSSPDGITIGALGEASRERITAEVQRIFEGGVIPAVVVRPARSTASETTKTALLNATSRHGAVMADYDETTGYARVGIAGVSKLEGVEGGIEAAGIDWELVIIEVEAPVVATGR